MRITITPFDLEEYIDKYGLDSLLASVARICYEKADHLRTNWQAKPEASDWETLGDQIEKTASNARLLLT